jgi:hypothetical protein
MKKTSTRVVAVAVALVAATVGASAALAGTGVGGIFNLGVTNTVDATSDLSGNFDGPQLRVTNAHPSGTAVRGRHTSSSGSAAAMVGETRSTSGGTSGVYGLVTSSSSAGDSNGVKGLNSGNGRGVYGQSASGTGVYGNSQSQYGVWGIGSYGVVAGGSEGGVWASTGKPTGSGVYGQNTANGNGVYGKSTSGKGVYGQSGGFDGVYGETSSPDFAGVSGHGGKFGVWGFGSTGVYGQSGSGYGVWGKSSGTAVFGESGNGVGVWGKSSETAVYAEGGKQGIYAKGSPYSGSFDGLVTIAGLDNPVALSTSGNILVDGSITATGTKDFKIDHPLAPRTKYLLHAAVESPEVLNVYSGNVTTDARGFATVRLPRYFAAINKDFRYQLTPVGGLVLAAVAQEIRGNRFVVQTSKPHTKVSWQVTAVRNDRYLRAHPFRPEQPKLGRERGRYLDPELYGRRKSAGIVRSAAR